MSQAASMPDPLIDEIPSRYVVGIDLGTTNSAVAYVDTHDSDWSVRIFSIPQLVAAAAVESRETLPSVHYEAAAGESTEGVWRLPWSATDPQATVGVFAREQGATAPGRMIISAKSWLSHAGVDRSAALLPWHGMADVEKLSPVEVSARILRHIRDAWDHRFPDEPLARQDIVLTLPASFDEVARELTVAAAAEAGLPRVVLLEEPQAAFYAWVYQHRDQWQQHVRPGQTILVCDIGGGTSDFTLIQVRAARSRSEVTTTAGITESSRPADSSATPSGNDASASPPAAAEQDTADDEADGCVQFHRVAVGNHLILGGDNLDLALARHLEERLVAESRLPPEQWDVLVRKAQRIKEDLMSLDAPSQVTLTLSSSGARLLAGSQQLEVKRDEVIELLTNGFLPSVELSEQPEKHASGFQEFGLPYAADPAITRHLAGFLSAHRQVIREQSDPLEDEAEDSAAVIENVDPARPDILLFNGGFFASDILRQRLIDQIGTWFRTPHDPAWAPQILDNDRLDLAVARGAAYFGMVRRGCGVRIAASLARSYYVGVESDEDRNTPAAVCLVPGSAQPGEHLQLTDRTFQLRISEPVEFPLFSSSTRLTDQPGQLVPIDLEQMTPLAPIRTVLRTQRRRETGTVPIQLEASLTEIGTIELGCRAVDRDRSWRLQFDVRSATQTDIAVLETAGEAEGYLDEQTWEPCSQLIQAVFSPDGSGEPERLVKKMAAVLQISKNQWPTALLRRIWESLMEFEAGRRRSAVHEARWLNLLGFSLRPGYGFAVDDWRVTETWRTVQGRLAHGGATTRNEVLILWRRIAGGLSRGQQQALADPLIASLRNLHARYTGGKVRGQESAMRPHELDETIRLLASLELLDVPRKVEMGRMLVDLLPKRKLEKMREPIVWAIGRLGQRQPVYGPLNTVVPRQHAETWLDNLLRIGRDRDVAPLAVMQLARKTGDRYRDLSDAARGDAVAWLETCRADDHLVELIRDGGRLDDEEQRQVFGEALPQGLRLERS